MLPTGFMPVLIIPGITTLTPTGASISASSPRRPSEMPSTACFDAVYGPMPGMAVTAAIEAVFTTQPGSPDARMRGTNAWMPWMTPQRSTSMTRCHSESGSSHELPPATMPALL